MLPTLLLSLLLCLLAAPGVNQILTLLRGYRAGGRHQSPEPSELPRLLFLVPAHDEETHIAGCIRCIQDQDYPPEKLSTVLIADNCSDGTAEIGVSAGAAVLERSDLTSRGKPYAISWALERLPLEVYDSVVIVDADTRVGSGFAKALARLPALRRRIVQGYFGVLNPSQNSLTRMAAVFAAVRYEVDFPSKSRAGLNCPLTGNGMALGTDLLVKYGWSEFSLTENWELYAKYSLRGVEIAYAKEARLYSLETVNLSQAQSQRARWTTGRFAVLRHWWRDILCSRSISIHQKLDLLCELANPGPVVRAGLVVAVGLAILGVQERAVMGVAALALAGLGYEIAATIVMIGRSESPLRMAASFAWLPVYAFWRLGSAVADVVSPPKSWTRTARQ